jgi:TonB family protein
VENVNRNFSSLKIYLKVLCLTAWKKGGNPIKMNQIKQQIIIITFSFLTHEAFGQITETVKEDTSSKVSMAQTMPEFNGGFDRIARLFEEELNYPKSARKARIGGKVVATFLVDTFGHVTDINILEGITPDIDKEAVRLIGLLKNWTPGTQDGRKVKVKYMIPMYFYPDNRFKREYLKIKAANTE